MTIAEDIGAASAPAALYRRTEVSPEDFFQILGKVRRAARDEIERLITWLDSTIDADQDAAVDDAPCDGDPDAEPSLGSFDSMSDQIKAWHVGYVALVDSELDRSDDEPSLATVNTHHCQTRMEGNRDDREGDGCADDRESDELQHGGDGAREDDEPSLGWTREEAASGRYPNLMVPDREAGPEPHFTEEQQAARNAKRSNVGPIIAAWRVE